jgi:acyl-CoA dehydrogenase family member 9
MVSLKNNSVSPARALFLGEFVIEAFHPFPTLSTDESETVSLVIESVRRFMQPQRDLFREYDREGEFPEEYVSALKELGLFGLIIPEMHGGLGLSASGYARVMQEIARFDAATAVTLGAHSSIGLKGLILCGSEEQKEKYLPRLATGDIIAAFCLTEPSSGSDASSIRTRVKRTDDGWLLSGEKLWISNGAFAEFFTVFARHEEDPEKLSAFIVERGFGGVSHGPKEDKMGIRASATTSVLFDNVALPRTALLGDEGKGFKIAMSILNSGRTGLGGGCIGAMKECIALASEQVLNRAQFGKKLAEFELIQMKLSTMAEYCYASESVVEVIGGLIDRGVEDYSVEAAIGKVFSTEALWYVANESLQIAGGNGFMRDYPYERIVRDSRINMIFEGTNEILRLYIALTGLRGVGEYLQELGSGLSQFFQDPLKGFDLLSDYATKKLAGVLGAGVPELLKQSPSYLTGSVDVLVRYAHRLAQAGEQAARTYRKEIVQQQIVLKHLADVAIELFVIETIICRILSQAKPGENEVLLANRFIQGAKRRMAYSLRRVSRPEETAGINQTTLALTQSKGCFWKVS